ncbi:MAG: fumarate hydratase C-terminal domain-containing protein [Deltaproteobacteria bacterium]|jgi:fumarate hydratase subunit beta
MHSIPHEEIEEKMEAAFDDLWTEDVRRLEVESFPVIVIGDTRGSDLYIENVKKYKRE